jgi:serine/threonine protein kinase
LAERTTSRSDLLARVKTLLAADERASLRTGGAVEAVSDTPAPDRLGGYRIGERIGAGGMGSVFRAMRDRGDFEHLAAVKIIKPGLLSQRLVDRFRRERQILAQLRHPNIAQLFDGGETDDGSPYIVMEYVEGQPLLEWAEKASASKADRIDKLLQACAAVSFAHANLIVHRDITPSNVLVTEGGAVKLIDFGIARPAAPLAETFVAPPNRRLRPISTRWASWRRNCSRRAGTIASLLPSWQRQPRISLRTDMERSISSRPTSPHGAVIVPSPHSQAAAAMCSASS